MTERWEIETGKYIPRMAALADHFIAEQRKLERLPPAPFSTPLTLEHRVAVDLASFAQHGVAAVDQLFDNVRFLWREGRMVGVSGLVRFSVEYWAAIYFGLRIIRTYLQDNNLEEAARKTSRLTQSGKTPVRLPWDGETVDVAYNVKTFVDALAKERSKVSDHYNFLSQASHPNFLQNTYFMMASKVHDNFSNETFRVYAHEILDKTVTILEEAVLGTLMHAGETVRLALPLCPKV